MNDNLFKPVVPADKLNPHFIQMQTHPSAEPARIMAAQIFQSFPNPDGNFIEQFQTTGFDSRVFELYLFAYFSNSGFVVKREFDRPDFVIEKDGLKVAVEATTANPSTLHSDVMQKAFEELSEKEFQQRLSDELPIRFGSPLYSKLNKKYWELPHCKNLPIVLAIEAFFEDGSLLFSDSSLSQYLYGLNHFPTWSENGQLVVKSTPIEEHAWNTKTIPSNFFKQPDTTYISAIIFSNSGTYAKFQRMGYYAGYHRGNIEFIRKGFCYSFKPNAVKPLPFSFNIAEPLVEETWGEGLMVLHNPNAINPLPHDYFPNAAEGYLKDNLVKTDMPPFYPYMSQTFCVCAEPIDSPPIFSLTEQEFSELFPTNPQSNFLAVEKEWYSDTVQTLLGSVLLDNTDHDWTYVILGKDENRRFRWIEGESSLKDRSSAREHLIAKMKEILLTKQKIFPQSTNPFTLC
ncbi:MAG: glycosaminoglycan attachment protein [Dehalococcoidia bacterium]|nr:MAG: glycosaminoglycan attachment protein [Dehalococcoidia bacterium]